MYGFSAGEVLLNQDSIGIKTVKAPGLFLGIIENETYERGVLPFQSGDDASCVGILVRKNYFITKMIALTGQLNKSLGVGMLEQKNEFKD